MRHPWNYLTFFVLLALFISCPPIAISGSEGASAVKVPLLAASQKKVIVQVSAFKERSEAENEAARLKSLGVDAFIRHESVQGKGMWYRVYAGQFENQNQAGTYASALKRKGIISWFWIKSVSLPMAPTPVNSVRQSDNKKSQKAAAQNLSESQKPPLPSTSLAAKGAVQTMPTPQNVTTLSQQNGVPASSPSTKTVMAEAAPKASLPEKTEPAAAQDETSQADEEAGLNWGVQLKSQTTLRAFERNTSKGTDTLVAPLYQFLQLDFGDSEAGGWTMHLYGWGRYDLADSANFENSTDGELLHGYLEYSKPYSAFRLALGRQQIFAGVTNEAVDGLQVSTGMGEHLSATVFGGVTAGSKESSADTTYGGRLVFHPQPHYALAISYQDTDLEGLPDQRVGADLSFNWSDWLTVQGLSSYNLDSEDWREHNYSVALRFKDVILEPAYQFFSYADYFGTGKQENNLFTFLKDTNEQVTIFGGDLQYQGDTPVRIAGRYNQYTYDVRGEDAAYYAALMSVDLPDGSQLGGEAGRMDGETADNIYTLYRAYFYWANPFRLRRSTFISGDAVHQDYDAPVFGQDDATHYSLSGGMYFFDDTLEVKLTGLYSQDPYFDENVEGILTFRINY